MGLFDRTPLHVPARTLKKPTTLKKPKKEEVAPVRRITERQKITEAWRRGPHEPIIVGPMCTCDEKPYPHDAHTEDLDLFNYHRRLRYKPTSAAPIPPRSSPVHSNRKTTRRKDKK